MSIKQKLLLICAIVFAGMVVMSGLFLYSDRVISDLRHGQTLVTQVEADMLMLRRNEKDFMARNDLKYLEKFNNNFELMSQTIHELEGALSLGGIEGNQAQQLITILEKYRGSFHEIVEIQQQIGLHEKDGLYGRLRQAVHGVESELKSIEEDRLLKDMLMLRRNEKDFMLRLNEKYLQKFENNYAIFLGDLSDTVLPMAQLDKIESLMQLYRKDFISLVEGVKRKGLSSKLGLHGEMRATVHESETLIEKLSNQLNEEFEVKIAGIEILVLSVAAVIAAVIIGLILFVERSIIGSIKSLAQTMREVKEKENLVLRSSIIGRDEIADMANDFNQMMDGVLHVMREVVHASDKLQNSSGELSTITEETSSGLLVQQSETEAVASAINEMAATVQEVSHSSTDAAQAANEADTAARSGQQVVSNAVTTIEELAARVENASDVIQKLDADSKSIGTILDVIRDIAEQTNLLALNAAIEAARAGEQGRGFAVVADEVRTLAQRTQESTQEIQTMIEHLQAGAHNAVSVMESGRAQADESVQQASEANERLTEITQAVSNILDQNTQIASAAEEQSAVAEELNRNVQSIREVVNQTAEHSHRTASAGTEVASLAHKLGALAGKFKTS